MMQMASTMSIKNHKKNTKNNAWLKTNNPNPYNVVTELHLNLDHAV